MLILTGFPVKLFLCVIASQWKLGFLSLRCCFVPDSESQTFVFSLILIVYLTSCPAEPRCE